MKYNVQSTSSGSEFCDSPAHTALANRVDSCLDWAARVVDASRISESAEFWNPDTSEAIRPTEKLLIEAALLALISKRAIGNSPALERLLEAILNCEESLTRMYELIRWHPYLWTSAGAVWVFLDCLGVGDEQKRSRLRVIWQRESMQPRERVPYRLLDQAWVRSIATGSIDLRLRSSSLLSCTAFGNLDGGLFMSRNDFYAVTHTPMYITDFGNWDPAPVAPGWLGPLGLSRLLVSDLDLAAEFAIAGMLTSPVPESEIVVVVSALSSLWDQLGFLPAPSFRDRDYQDARDADAYMLYHTYHTTFVYALLCCVCLITNTQHSQIGKCLSQFQPKIPDEWNGYQTEATSLANKVMHTVESWHILSMDRGIELDEQLLLRSVLDAYLIHTFGSDMLDDLLSLRGMGRIVGSSVVERAVSAVFDMRLGLTGSDSITDDFFESVGSRSDRDETRTFSGAGRFDYQQ